MPLTAQETVYYPTTEWRTSTPEEQGIDSEALAAFIERVPRLGDLDSLMIVRNGYVVAEVYWHPFSKELRHELHSASKSIISILVGIALDKGFLTSLDQKVLEFFSEVEIQNLDDNKRAMTVRDLITMRSGLDCDILEGNDPVSQLINQPDATQFGLNWTMVDAPGSTFRYCQIDVYLLSAILAKVSGMNTMAFAEQYLFAPLGITNVDWNTSAEGLPLGFAGLRLDTQGMAKIGYLVLNAGRWGDRQIVSTAWLNESTQPSTVNAWVSDLDYGYLWWTNHTPSGDFVQADGGYFQHIRVSTARNLVVVDTGTDQSLELNELFNQAPIMQAILGMVQSDEPLPPNPEGMNRLEAAIQAAANPQPQSVSALPAQAALVSGKTYQLNWSDLLLADLDQMSLPPEDWQMAALGLDFGQDQATLKLVSVSGIELNIPVGLNGVYQMTSSPLGTLAAKGRWTSESRFQLYLRRLEQGVSLRYTFNFTDDGFTGSVMSARLGDNNSYRVNGQMVP